MLSKTYHKLDNLAIICIYQISSRQSNYFVTLQTLILDIVLCEDESSPPIDIGFMSTHLSRIICYRLKLVIKCNSLIILVQQLRTTIFKITEN